MRKAADLIKKQIVQIDTGNVIGNVVDLLIDPDEQRLAAVLTVTPRWLRESALVPWEQIVVASGDVILVLPGTEPIPASAKPRLRELLERKIHVSGTPVLSKSGAKVGSVGELMIDDQGRIQGYVVSSGFLGSERQFVAAENVEAVGADALIIRDGSATDILPTSEAEELADELKHSIVLPLTGTRLLVDPHPAAGSEIARAAVSAPLESTQSSRDGKLSIEAMPEPSELASDEELSIAAPPEPSERSSDSELSIGAPPEPSDGSEFLIETPPSARLSRVPRVAYWRSMNGHRSSTRKSSTRRPSTVLI